MAKSKSKKKSSKEKVKNGCCTSRPPPAYLDYGLDCGKPRSRFTKTGNPMLDRLKHVDVIEELQYQAPGGDATDDEFEFFSICNGCGEMEVCKSPNQKKKNPVTYSRRQRFNFSDQGNGEGNDNMVPSASVPFAWPTIICSCPCCSAGLRRDPCCECVCCVEKGNDRVTNPFDEIPVGKNPEYIPKPEEPAPRAKVTAVVNESRNRAPSSQDVRDEVLPVSSGIYYFDASTKQFVKREQRPPSPIVIQYETPRPPPPPVNTQVRKEEDVDLFEVVRCLRDQEHIEKRCCCCPAPPQQQPQPIVMPAVHADNMDMYKVITDIKKALNLNYGLGGSSYYTQGSYVTGSGGITAESKNENNSVKDNSK